MAKIIHTALVSSIHKKMHGSILRRRKGHTLLSQGQKPRDPHSPRQMQLRGHFNYLAGKWGTLSSVQKGLWNTHASGLEKTMSGFNDYVRMNTRLLAASYSTLVIQSTPPTTPSTPAYPTDFAAMQITSTSNRISWATPSSPSRYVEIHLSAEPGFSYTGKRRWALITTRPSNEGGYNHTHEMPSGIPMIYRLLVIDPQGRLSPPTHAELVPSPDFLYLCDKGNDRIKEHRADTLAYFRMFGEHGAGNSQFNDPRYCTTDTQKIYVSDRVNDRLKIFDRGSLDFSQLKTVDDPRGVCVDDTHVYVMEYGIDSVVKYNKTTLTQVDTGDAPFGNGMDQDETDLFIASGDFDRIYHLRKSDMGDLDVISCSNGVYTRTPEDVCVDDTYLWATIPSDHEIWKFNKSTGNFIEAYGSHGSGDAQFDTPRGITRDGQNLYIADSGNSRIKKHRLSDWTFVKAFGSLGSGTIQFNTPWGVFYWGGSFIWQ